MSSNINFTEKLSKNNDNAPLPIPPPPPPHQYSQHQPILPIPGGFNFLGLLGHPMMQSTVASTPATGTATSMPTTEAVAQQLLHRAAAAAAPSGGKQTVTISSGGKQPPPKGKKKRGRPKGSGSASGKKKNPSGTRKPRKKNPAGKKRKSQKTRPAAALPTITIVDDDPKRLTNPLIDVPYVEPPAHAQAADVWVHASLAFSKPDTFPLAYHARLLGFDASPRNKIHSAFVGLNPSTLPLVKTPGIYKIPPLGTWFSQTQQQNQLEFVDPFYKLLQNQPLPETLTPTTSISKLTRELQAQVLRELECSSLDISTSATPEGMFIIKLGSVECRYNYCWFPISGRESELVLVVHGLTIDEEEDVSLENQQLHVLVVVCLVLQHARSSHVWYGLFQFIPTGLVGMLETLFGMKMMANHYSQERPTSDDNVLSTAALAKTLYQAAATIVTSPVTTPRKSNEADASVTTTAENLGDAHFLSDSTASLLCDLHLSSTRYAWLLYQQQQEEQTPTPLPHTTTTTRQRMLVRLPTVDQASSAATSSPIHVSTLVSTTTTKRKSTTAVTSVKEGLRNTSFGIRITTSSSNNNNDGVKVQVLNESGQVVKKSGVAAKSPAPTSSQQNPLDALADAAAATTTPVAAASLPASTPAAASLPTATTTPATAPTSTGLPPPDWDVLKIFTQIVPTTETQQDEDGEILRDLKAKQAELAALEGGMETKVRSLLQQVVDERMEFELHADKREKEREMLKAYSKVLDRRKEIDTAWQKQLEQDMDAVCEICRDGRVTPDNQIIFCEACNVAVHQMCYGIEEVPEGDYYCIACRFLGRDKTAKALSQRGGEPRRVAPSPLPICCELCPHKQGAFVRSDTSSLETKNSDGSTNPVLSKWVHVVCAKWQGLNFVPPGQTEVVEDVQELKKNFLRHGYSCILCLGRRGAYVKCREEGCTSWMHVTCARATGLCEVSHGEDCDGEITTNPWTLLCPQHSTIDPASVTDTVSIEQLVRAAQEFPPEPIPADRIKVRPTKGFNKLTGKERRKFLADPDYEKAFVQEISKKLHGVHCEVCHQVEDNGKDLTQCCGCGVVFCASCVLDADIDPDEKEYRCPACKYIDVMKKDGEEYEDPQCTLCFQKGGWLREAYAEPVNRKSYWKQHPEEFEETLFAKDLWCHAICTMWHPKVAAGKDGTVNCSSIIMSNGKGHVTENVRCALCGDNRKLKVTCSEEGCRCWGQKRGAFSFHVTCAREAGLEVTDKQEDTGRFYFDTKCFRHGGADFALRARMEDLIETERRFFGKRFEKWDSLFMSFAHASRLFNKAIIVMKMLGWAWRWAEWWVEFGDNWEPLLEPGEREEDMTKEELKIVDSTRESRCEAARKCRLAALGAALRNRDYDKAEGDDRVALGRALRAVLHTPELVGPLEQYEIDFFSEWLARVYRSKSRLLGFGDDKIPIHGHVRTLHIDDQSPKYILGARRLPGKQELPEGEVFETDFHDVDDFLKPEMYDDGTLVTEESLRYKRARAGNAGDEPKELPQRVSKRGKRSQYGSRAEGSDAATAPSELDPSLCSTVTLAAVYTEATTEASRGEQQQGVSRVNLLPSPVKAVILKPPENASRKRKAPAPKKPGRKKKRGGWPKGKKRTPHPSPQEDVEDATAAMYDGSTESATQASKKRGGWPKGKKRGTQSRPSKPVIAEESPGDKESDEEVMPVPKRRGRAAADSTSSVKEEAPVPKKRMGRPPKSRRAADTLSPGTATRITQSDGQPTETQAPGEANVGDSTAFLAGSAAMEGDVMIGNIAERIKRRRGCTVDPPIRSAALNDDQAAAEETAAVGDSSENTSSREDLVVPQEASDSGSEKTESTDDNVTIAAYVQAHRAAQGESLEQIREGMREEETTSASSEGEHEVPISQLTPRQRGRRQGKLNAVRDMWGR